MLEPLLIQARDLGASDIHLSAGMPPMLRVAGALQSIETTLLGNAQVRGMIDSVLPESQRRTFAEGVACDFAFASSADGLGRYRANAYRQQRGGGVSAATDSRRGAHVSQYRCTTHSAKSWPNWLRDWWLVVGATGSVKAPR